MEQNFVNSDRAMGPSSILLNNLATGASLPIQRPSSVSHMPVSAAWSGSKPPATYEKLWRGLALVGAAHLAGLS